LRSPQNKAQKGLGSKLLQGAAAAKNQPANQFDRGYTTLKKAPYNFEHVEEITAGIVNDIAGLY
jgi:hypothetical protein